MTLEQLNALFSGNDVAAMVTGLKVAKPTDGTAGNKLSDWIMQYGVAGHDVMQTSKRLDKTVKVSDTESRIERVNRIAIGMQELICERAVSFLFGSPVKIHCEPDTDGQAIILKAISRILKDNKIDSFNSEIALNLFRATETAECWFSVDASEAHENYGFSTRKKLKVVQFSPWHGDTLYPLFDDTGDLIAFSREYIVKEGGKNVTYIETYTADYKRVWKQAGTGWEEAEKPVKNPINKIPIVYAAQNEVEWASVQNLIDRLEKLLSNYADTMDYHASPTIIVEGEVKGFAQKGEAGKLLQLMDGAKASYLSWQQAPDMVKLEIETLFRLIYSLSQTPDISFEAVKGLGDISGIALKMLFLDAHLKVKKKQRVFDAYLERRMSLIKAFISLFSVTLAPDCKLIDIDTVIQPFQIENQKDLIDNLVAANAGKALISQKTAIKLSGLVDDVDGEYAQLLEEEQTSKTIDLTQPTF